MVPDPPDEAVEDAETAACDAAPAAPDRWPDDDDPLPDGWAEVDVDPAPQRAGVDWAALEVSTARVLPAGLLMAGHTELVRVSLLGARPVDARLSTADRRSRLHATMRDDPETGGVRLDVSGLDLSVNPRKEDGLLVVDAEVRLGALRIPVVLTLEPTPAEPNIVLGADDLAGHVVVDPASAHRLGEPE
jgi:hypothetical protein